MHQERPLFRHLSPEGWHNLALASLVIFYAAQVVLEIVWHNFCGRLAIDYCAFWSAGHIAITDGFTGVYDLQRLEEVQRLIFPPALKSVTNFPTIPAPYLPVFLLPFVVLSPLGPVVGYVVWTAINILTLIAYLRFFGTRMMGAAPRRRLVIMMLIAYPVFLNFLYGQVNIWLTICVGEYMRAALGGRPFRSGLWLAGLLLKPQYLALIVIVLLMQKSMKALAGLSLMTAVLLGISYAMIGGSGFHALLELLLGFAGGLPATGPNVMMNWRAVGLYLVNILDPMLVWLLIALAMLVTALVGLFTWRRRIEAYSPLFAVALLGTLAATAAFVWHSHASSAAILICPLLIRAHIPPRLPKYTLEAWVLVPPVFHLVAIMLTDAAASGVVSGISPAFANLLSAIAPFAFNLFFLVWATRCLEGNIAAEQAVALP